MKVGLYFGSFNPIHIGHLVIANHLANHSDLDQIWLVVSPQNPHKKKSSLLADHHRLALVKLAIDDNPKLRASDIEFKLPQPSYTVNTLAYLKEEYPKNAFTLIMGEDNLRSFHKWKNYEQILKNHEIVVYPRVLTTQELEKVNSGESLAKVSTSIDIQKENITVLKDTPIMKISSSFIRKAIKENKSVKYLLTPEVGKYCDEMNFYR
ncbi:MAG: nicotinate (nicotinamide) nucleotide adenylyltransferase [Lishizhenia sp.]